MLRHHLQRHRYKVVVGVPIAVLIASSLSFIRSPEEMCVVPEDNRYVEVGELVTLHVIAESDEPVNVLSATMRIPSDLLEVDSISREGSIIDLWSEEPAVDGDTIHFSGGIVSESGFLGNGIVLTLLVRPVASGTAIVSFEKASMLAHDGTGMEVTCGKQPITLIIRPSTHPSPDVNGDDVVNIFDFGLVSTRLFMAYNRSYDLNMDGKITLADLGIIISNITDGSNASSIALLWRY